MIRLGAYCALAFGLLLLAGIAIITPPFGSMGADATAAANAGGRVAYVASLPAAQRTQLGAGFALEFVAFVFLVPALVGLNARVSRGAPAHGGLGTALGGIGVVLLVLSHTPRFALLAAAEDWAVPGTVIPIDVGRESLAVAYRLSENFGSVTASMFWLFAAASLIAFALGFARAGLPRWLAWWAWLVAILGFVGGAGVLVAEGFGFLQFVALVLLCLWWIAAGTVLLRERAAAMPPLTA